MLSDSKKIECKNININWDDFIFESNLLQEFISVKLLADIFPVLGDQ